MPKLKEYNTEETVEETPVVKGDFMNVFIPRDDMNPKNTHVVGSINGIDYKYERGRVHKVTRAEGLEMLLVGAAIESR